MSNQNLLVEIILVSSKTIHQAPSAVMLKRYCLLSVCLFYLGGICLAQSDRQIDSLLSVLKIQSSDTAKVNTLLALNKRSIGLNKADDAKRFANEALVLAEKIKFRKGISAAKNSIGYSFIQAGRYFYKRGNFPDGLKEFLSALRVFEKNQFKEGIATALMYVGHVYLSQENYSKALEKYLVALDLLKQGQNKNLVGAAYNDIGSLYENQENYQDALKYYYLAIKSYEEAGNKQGLIDRYFNIGFLYEDQGNYTEALKNHQIALRISEEIGWKNGVIASNGNLGGLYWNMANLPEALKHYILALKGYEESGNVQSIAMCKNDVGSVYLDMKNYPLSKQYLSEALTTFKELGMVENIKSVYETMTSLDSATGNFAGALEDHKQFILFRDSLSNEEVTNAITKNQLQYEFDKKSDSIGFIQSLTSERLKQQTLLAQRGQQSLLLKEKELQILGKEKELQLLQTQKDSVEISKHKAESDKQAGELVILNKQKEIQDLAINRQKLIKKYLVGGLALLLLLSFFIYRNYRNRQQLKLQLLRNKIASDLHDDIGSTLSSISIFSQMAQQQSKEVNPLLETIGENSRKMLDAMADIVWTINPENDQFEQIVLRMRSFAFELLGAKNIDFEFKADEDVSKMKLSMDVRKNLYLIFKEALNNMAKYSRANKALFDIKEDKNVLSMLIHDNGKGFDMLQTTPGNGLRNMKKRADEIGAKLLIDSNPDKGTTIQLNVSVN